MLVRHLFPITEGLLAPSRKSSLRLLQDRGWLPTTVQDEFRHPEAPGYSVDLDPDGYQGGGPFGLYQGSRKLAQLTYPPYAQHLNLRKA